MKRKLKLSTLMMLGIAIIAIPSANAQNCDVPPIVRDLLKKATSECQKQDGSDATLKECSSKGEIFRDILKIWNETVGPSSAAVVGPRSNTFGIPQNGRAVSPGGRLFFTEISDQDTVSFTIKKRGGKADCDITICAVDEKGVPSRLKTVSFPANAEVGKVISESVNLGKGKVLTLFFNSKGGVGKAFEFKLTTSK